MPQQNLRSYHGRKTISRNIINRYPQASICFRDEFLQMESGEYRIVNDIGRGAERKPCCNCYCYGYPCMNCLRDKKKPCVVGFCSLEMREQHATYSDYMRSVWKKIKECEEFGWLEDEDELLDPKKRRV